MQAAIDRLKESSKKEDMTEISAALDGLTAVWHEVSAKLYQQQSGSKNAQADNGGQGNSGKPTSGQDAVDADFEVVN